VGDVLLVRHGETRWSLSGQHTSYTDLPLTAHGEEQAKSLAPLLSLRSLAAVRTCPLGGGGRTAELADLSGAVPDEELHEWDYGGYEGVSTADIHRDRPGWDLWTDGVPPGPPRHPGESAEQVGRRADRVLARVRADLARGDGDVVLVAHAHFLRVLTARWLGLPPVEGRLFRLETGTVSRLSTEHDRPVIAEWNTRP
jgi:probable phosphoglycerate mutase